MLSSQQIDTIQGIVCSYDSYVVYYYADYHEYQVYETRDNRIVIYAGSDISYADGSFTFGEDTACYYLTYNKYMESVTVPSAFTVPHSELVYTNLVADYPDLCFWESKFQNANIGGMVILMVGISLAIDVVFHVIFGGRN